MATIMGDAYDSEKRELMRQLDPQQSAKMLATLLMQRNMTGGPGQNGAERQANMANIGALDGSTDLGQYEAMRASPTPVGGGSMGSNWQTSPLAQSLMAGVQNNQQAVADYHDDMVQAKPEHTVDSFGGVKETPLARRDFLMQLLSRVR